MVQRIIEHAPYLAMTFVISYTIGVVIGKRREKAKRNRPRPKRDISKIEVDVNEQDMN